MLSFLSPEDVVDPNGLSTFATPIYNRCHLDCNTGRMSSWLRQRIEDRCRLDCDVDWEDRVRLYCDVDLEDRIRLYCDVVYNVFVLFATLIWVVFIAIVLFVLSSLVAVVPDPTIGVGIIYVVPCTPTFVGLGSLLVHSQVSCCCCCTLAILSPHSYFLQIVANCIVVIVDDALTHLYLGCLWFTYVLPWSFISL